MNVFRKIEITEKQAAWLDKEIANGNISSESSFIEEAITERIHQQNMQNPKYVAWLEAELQKGHESGVSEKSVDEIFAEARAHSRGLNAKI
jgi:antitoxin ParD1/3/4